MSAPSDSDKERTAILAARAAARSKLLARLDAEDADHHADRLRKCGQPVRLRCCDCRAVKNALTRCDLKWCPSCAPRIAHRKVKAYEDVVSTFRNPLLVTFTTRNFDARSKKETGMRATRRAFTRLKKNQRWWKRCVLGGVACFEMTRRKKGWHPHAHVLMDCAWFAVTVTRPPVGCSAAQFKFKARLACEEIAAQWSLALGRSGSVHVRKVRARAGSTLRAALRETMKYSVTAESLDKMTGKLGLFLDELDLTRNSCSFGSAYHHPALKKPKADAQPCDCCGAFGTFLPAEIIEAAELDKQRGRKKPPSRR